MGHSGVPFEQTIFAQQPGVSTERFDSAPRQADAPLASEAYLGIRPIGQLVNAVVGGQIIDFRRDGPQLALEGNALRVTSPVPSNLPAPLGGEGRGQTLAAFASSTYADPQTRKKYFVICPLTQIIYRSLAPEYHLRMIRFTAAADGQTALLLYRPAGAAGELVIYSPGTFLMQ